MFQSQQVHYDFAFVASMVEMNFYDSEKKKKSFDLISFVSDYEIE
jgi:hypothetical protein